MSLEDATALVKRRRPEARPIPAFIPMLEGYEKDIVLSQKSTATKGEAPKLKRKVVAGPSIGPALGPPKKKPSIGPSIGPAMIGPSMGPSTGPSIGPAIGPSIGPPRQPVGPSLPPPTSSTTKDEPFLDSKELSSTIGPSPQSGTTTTPMDTISTAQEQEDDETEKTEPTTSKAESSAGTIGPQSRVAHWDLPHKKR
jgi:hypothetical protein